MKNKYGAPLMLLGGAGVICGLLLLAFRKPGDSAVSCRMPIWTGILFACLGLYMSTRTKAQYKKEFEVRDERAAIINGKTALLSFLFMQFA